MKKLSVIGLGKLGLPMAACFADKGYTVIGCDVNEAVVASTNRRKAPIFEPGLDKLLTSAETLSSTTDVEKAVIDSEMTFIIVPTPSQEDGSFSTRYVENVMEKIASGIKKKNAYHVVVLTSTVLPNASEDRILPMLQKMSGKKCGKDFGYCYSPEFIALGSVIRNYLYPDVVLIGESDPQAGELLEEVYKNVCENDPPVVRTTIRSAELAKISLNAYVTMKISFANTIAELCEKLPGGDSEAISRVLGNDSRIGRKYLSGALAYGGPCFPRDNKAFAFFARQIGCEARLAEATDRENRHQVERIADTVACYLGDINGKKIAMLGLTYKPDTDVIEESAAIYICQALLDKGARISVYDPAGEENARQILGNNINYSPSAKDCLDDADFCILSTPWEEFKQLSATDFIERMNKPVLLDCWKLYDSSAFQQKLVYLAVGQYGGTR